MTSSSDPRLASFEFFVQEHPTIQYAIPSSPNYSTLRATYTLDNPAVPFAIVRPQNAEDVAAAVNFASANGIKPVVRSGGNSLFWKSMIQDALIIDMRDISYVNINDSKTSAAVGGGILFSDLGERLTKEGLATALGTIPFIGYVGWSTYGGYGPFSAQYGLGCDNIIGAKVVNWKGEVIEADRDMLRGIRGAGGAFGPIVELTIKLYPLKSILAGMIIYDSTDIATTIRNFNSGYQELLAKGLPPALCVQQLVMNSPHGKLFICAFIWGSSDYEAGQAYLAKIAALGNVVDNTVRLDTIAGYLQLMKATIPPNAYGSIETISIRELNPEAIAVITRNIEKMPSVNGACFFIHELRGPSAVPTSESTFGSREPHMVLELIKTVAEQRDLKRAEEWVDTFIGELRKMDPGNILPGTYISITKPGSNSFENIFGSNYEALLEMKRKYDPEGTFSLAQPELNSLK
ncbi:D-lactate dehydrogenase [Stipitochalara longipes BDJ]|nr:D-lactate dehydrogenase [Stipitochalara longipes BDJ]